MARAPGNGSRLVTLSSDIGSLYAAQVRAALLGYVPAERIVDITHELPAHQIREAAFLVRHIAARFPPGTVHVVIVDPGVGGTRAPVAVRCRDTSALVGPDNGVLYPLAHELGIADAVRLEPGRVSPGSSVSATFEGRDLFAPAAGRLAQGVALARLGVPWKLDRLELPEARRVPGGARGEVLHVDRFGNLITNVPSAWAPGPGAQVQVQIGEHDLRTQQFVTYEAMPPQGLGLVGSSFGLLELSVREGRAADRLGVVPGAGVVLRWPRRRQDRK